jgi:hypothetical protein
MSRLHFWTCTLTLALFALMVLIPFSGNVSASPVSGWGTSLSIDTLDGIVDAPSISVNPNGYAVVAWSQKIEWYRHVFASIYSPGEGWSSPFQLSETYWDDPPQISTAIDDQADALVVYGGLSRSYSHLTGWGSSNQIGTDIYSHALAMGPQGDAVLIFSIYNASIDKNQLCFRNYQKGLGWTTEGKIFQEGAVQILYPTVGIDQRGRVIAAWTMGDSLSQLLYVSCYDGAVWTPIQLISPSSAFYAIDPELAINSNGDAVLAYSNWWGYWEGNHGIWASQYSSGIWTVGVGISSSEGVSVGSWDCAIDAQGDAWVVWDQMNGQLSRINWNRYLNGTGWGQSGEVGAAEGLGSAFYDDTTDVGDQYNPQVALGSADDAVATWVQLNDPTIWPYDYLVISNRYEAGGWRGEERLGRCTLADKGVGIGVDQSDRAIAAWNLDSDIQVCHYSQEAGAPSAPRCFHVEAGDLIVNLSWSPPLDDGGMGVIGYKIYRSNGSGDICIGSLSADITSLTDADVVNGVTYRYSASAMNVNGEGIKCVEMFALPSGPPGVPRDVSFSHIAGDIFISWSPPESDGGTPIQGYHIYRGITPETMELYYNLPAVSSYWSDSIYQGMTCYYSISAYNLRCEGPWSEKFMVHNDGPPDPPMNLTVAVQVSRNSVEWTPPLESDAPVSGYKVYWSVMSLDPMLLISVNSTTFQVYHEGISDGLFYSYWVSAVSAIGEGSKAGPVTVQGIAPTFTFISPPLGSSWICGETMNISWTSKYVGDNVRLEWGLLVVEFERTLIIANSTPNDGEFQWIIPNMMPSNAYRVMIVDVASPGVFSFSEYIEIEANPSTAPITKVTLSGPQITPPYYVGAVAVTINATDPGGEGVDYTEYLPGGGNWIRYQAPFIVSGSLNLYFRSVDKGGAIESVKTCSILIDLQDPSITVISPGEGEVVGPYAKIYATASDDSSGLTYFKVSIDGGDWEFAGPSWYLPIEGSFAEGAHVAHYVARDNAGRVTEYNRSFTVDLSRPYVLASSPQGTGVSVMSNLTIEFSKSMRIDTVVISGLFQDSIWGNWGECTWLGKELTISLDTPLLFGNSYQISISGMDSIGNDMYEPFFWNFTTTLGFWGEVRDENQNAVPNVTVEVWANGSLLATISTDLTGRYAVACSVGNYTIITHTLQGEELVQVVNVGFGQNNSLMTIVKTGVTPAPDDGGLLIVTIGVIMVTGSLGAVILARRKWRR